MVEPLLQSGVYRHFKGTYMPVLGAARHSETDESFVAYVPLGPKPGPRITVRPYEMFFETVERDGKSVPRFEYVGEQLPEDFSG